MIAARAGRRAAIFAVIAIAAGASGAWWGNAAVTKPVLAAEMSAVEKLVAENEIKQQILLYTLLIDGDGLNKKDVRTWADKLFTEDAVFETYGADGQLRSRLNGREDIYRQTAKSPDLPPGISGRHFNVATYFDEISPTTAKVRTITTMLTVTQRQPTGCVNLGDPACGGQPIRVTSFTYHDTFTKTDGVWKKSRSVIRSDL
jgi:hypothetical protein